MSRNKNSRSVRPGKVNHAAAAEVEEERGSVLIHNKNDSHLTDSGAVAFTEKQISSGRRTMVKAVRLRSCYPEAWEGIESHALDLAAKGQRISAQYLLECAKQKDYIDPHGNDLRITNDTAAVFARWLIAGHPELASHITTRPSIFDGLAVPCDPETGEPRKRYFCTLAAIYG